MNYCEFWSMIGKVHHAHWKIAVIYLLCYTTNKHLQRCKHILSVPLLSSSIKILILKHTNQRKIDVMLRHISEILFFFIVLLPFSLPFMVLFPHWWNLNPSQGVNCLIYTPEHGSMDSGKSSGRYPGWGHYPPLSPRGTKPLLPFVLIWQLCSNMKGQSTLRTPRWQLLNLTFRVFLTLDCFGNHIFLLCFPPQPLSSHLLLS